MAISVGRFFVVTTTNSIEVKEEEETFVFHPQIVSVVVVVVKELRRSRSLCWPGVRSKQPMIRMGGGRASQLWPLTTFDIPLKSANFLRRRRPQTPSTHDKHDAKDQVRVLCYANQPTKLSPQLERAFVVAGQFKGRDLSVA